MRRKPLERIVVFLSLSLFMLLQGGCIVVPVPIPETDLLVGRRSISKEELEQLVPGETSRLDVIMEYGEPDYASDDESVLAYRWEVGRAVVLWAVGGGYSAAGGAEIVTKTYLVKMKFDQDGRLEKWEIEDFIFDSAESKLDYEGTPISTGPVSGPIHPLVVSRPTSKKANPPMRIKVQPFEDARSMEEGEMLPEMIEFHYSWGKMLGVVNDVRLRMPVTDYIRQALVLQLLEMGHEIVEEDADVVIAGELEHCVFTIPMRIFTIAHASEFIITVHVSYPANSETKLNFHYELKSLEEGMVVEFMAPHGKIPLILDILTQLQEKFEADFNASLSK